MLPAPGSTGYGGARQEPHHLWLCHMHSLYREITHLRGLEGIRKHLIVLGMQGLLLEKMNLSKLVELWLHPGRTDPESRGRECSRI